MIGVEVLNTPTALLGEGLYVGKNDIYWLDIEARTLYRLDKRSKVKSFQLPFVASAILEVKNKDCYLITERGICKFDVGTKRFSVEVCFPKQLSSKYRPNDAVKLSEGCYIFGTMEKVPVQNSGNLYLSTNRKMEEMNFPIGIPNLFVVLSNTEILVSDSLEKKVYLLKYSYKSSKIESCDLWMDFGSEVGTPDGGCISSTGLIYIAMWDGGKVVKYDKKGNFKGSIALPVLRPTNCKLSSDESYLYITSASYGLQNNNTSNGKLLKVRLSK